jgi:phosphoribosyl 1,2-cyclic phosphodiesterase
MRAAKNIERTFPWRAVFWLPAVVSCLSKEERAILKFCVLASGSSGNCALVATERTRVLVDAGLSGKELARRLALIGEIPESLDAVVLTHEHTDHVAGLARLARKHNTPVYATWLTAPHLDFGECRPTVETFQAGARISIGDIDVQSFTLPHDAVDPIGLCFYAQGVKIGIVTDLGYVTDSIRVHLRGTHVLLLESNHDLEMLKVGPYPWSVKQRVMGRMGHLSNDSMYDFLSRDLDSSAARIILGHLSEHNNHPEIVRIMAGEALDRRGLGVPLVVASQRQPTEVFTF